MKKSRTKHTPEKKAEIVIKVLKEEQTIAQIASEYGIHPNQICRWKSELLKEAPMIFKNETKPISELNAKHEKDIKNLHEEIGRLTMQLNWLKKKSGISLE